MSYPARAEGLVNSTPHYYYHYYSLRYFYTSVSWESSTGVWMKASLLESPVLFSVFWLISVMQSPLFGRFSFLIFFFFLLTITRSSLRPGLGDPFLSQNAWEFYGSHSPGRSLVYAYTIWHYGQISVSYTIPSGLSSPLICV